jgi:phosphatidylglycerol:prolipoprotein diacylglycerol transferase
MENLISFWQFLPYKINPEIFSWGFFTVRWYFMGYLLGFFTVYLLVLYRFWKDTSSLDREKLIESLFWVFGGLILGARLGYVFFYDLSGFFSHPLGVFSPFVWEEGGFRYRGIYGMSYHGGLIGSLLAFWFYSKKSGLPFFSALNFILPAVPLGYFWGRMGNFFNGELWGRVTQKPWGMYFPNAYFLDGESFLRHPSQLYEALGEGIFIFILLWNLRNKKKAKAYLLPLYLFSYGTIRFVIEFWREPDEHLGFLLGKLSLGQLLCFLMIITGAVLWFFINRLEKKGIKKHSRA